MTQYIAIKEAADLSGKSAQTIRRMIKSKKLKYRKDRTPQGFNYLIDLESVKENFKLTQAEVEAVIPSPQVTKVATLDLDANPDAIMEKTEEVTPVETVTTASATDQEKPTTAEAKEASEEFQTPQAQATSTDLIAHDRTHQQIVSYEPVKEFTDTIQQLVVQHGKEKENLFKLIETFQNKVISLENKIKVEANNKKRWFRFW